MFSNIYQPSTYLKTRHIIAKVQFVMFTDCAKHTSAGALIHRKQTIYWIFTQSLAVSTDVNLLGLDEISSVAYNSGEMQTCNFLLLFDVDRLWRNPRKRVARGGELWSPKTLQYPNFSDWFFAVLRKSC